MYNYKMYDMQVTSDIPLRTALPSESNLPAVVTIVRGDLQMQCAEAVSHFEKPEGQEEGFRIISRVTREECFYYVERIGAFRITGGSKVEYSQEEENPWIFEQWLTNLCLGVIMIQRGRIVFHGSGLQINDRMIVISGESGSGKSTLADALLRDGYGFMADDAVALDWNEGQAMGCAGFPMRRLCIDVITPEYEKERLIYMPDGTREKYGYLMHGEYHDTPAPLAAVFILQAAEVSEVTVQELTGLDKLNHLYQCLYKRESYARMGVSEDVMQQMLQLAQTVRVYLVKRPLQGKTTETQKRLILELLPEK